MIEKKHLIIAILILSLFHISFAEKRRKPIAMEELTNPSSPSYVPCPYPKTRDEIIRDLKHWIKNYCSPREGMHEVIIGPPPPSRKILPDLLKEKPVYRIAEIVKVKNSSIRPIDYTWLVIILNQDGTIAARVVIDAAGLFCGMASYPPDWKPQYLKTEKDILAILSDYAGRPLVTKDVKKMERLDLPPWLGSLFVPAWEITLSDGSVYYYSVARDKVYKYKKRISWKMDENGRRPDGRKLIPSWNFAIDWLNEELIVFEELKKKNTVVK